jgi:hypothetical protein
MSNVIDFLERMGRDAQLRHADDSDVKQALQIAGIDAATGSAICKGDEEQLAAILKANPNVCAMIFPVEQESIEAPRDTEHVRQFR